MKSLKNRLKYEVPLKLNHFEKLYDGKRIRKPEEFEQLMFDNGPAQKKYENFRDRIVSSIGKRYLPIYRMADGEFKFCLGNTNTKYLTILYRNIKNAFFQNYYKGRKLPFDMENILYILDKNFFRVAHGEAYNSRELRYLYPKFIAILKNIAHDGVMAIHFIKVNGTFAYPEYSNMMLDWFDVNDINLSEDNYTSFYFLYALLNGPDRKYLYDNRSILIITHADDTKKKKITDSLKSMGGKKISFYDIGYNKSMKEIINVPSLGKDIDLVLVGGGVGALNILNQLRPLNTVCIDAGINIECLANPNLRRSRIFLKPSDEISDL